MSHLACRPCLPATHQPKGTIAITQATTVSKGSDLAPIGNEKVFKEVGEENIRFVRHVLAAFLCFRQRFS